MESYLNHGGPFYMPAHDEIDIDMDAIDQIMRQMQQQAQDWPQYGQEAIADDILGLSLPPHHHYDTTTSPQSPASSPHQWTLQDSPTRTTTTTPSFTTTGTSMTESPLMPEYEFPADWAAGPLLSGDDDNNAARMILLPDQAGIPLDNSFEWSMLGLEWTNACDGSGWSCWEEQGPQDDESSPQREHANSSLTPAVSLLLASIDNTVVESPHPSSPSATTTSSSPADTLVCAHCSAAFTDRTKLKIHSNKHTKPFRCTAPCCDYATAEKKSLQRHLGAKARWDEDHRLAAEAYGVREVKHRCTNASRGCTYTTIRDDNLKRHAATCTIT